MVIAPVALQELEVRPVARANEARYQEQMQCHHYLGALPKIGETFWYVATWRDHWLALIGFSAALLKCSARDRWIGWDFRTQYDRLPLIANNSRFLVLPDGRIPNLGSRVLALVERRIGIDWRERFGHPVWLLETFVDPSRFHGGVYRAANWLELGLTRGHRRTRAGYSPQTEPPKRVFVRPLCRGVQHRLTHPNRATLPLNHGPKLMLNAEQMRSLSHHFLHICDPRRAHGRRHRLPVVLALAAGATLCGMRGYKAFHQWAESLGQAARARFGCRKEGGRYVVPSEFVIRDCLVRIEPGALDAALTQWSQTWGVGDDALAMDGKTMKQAVDAQGQQTHILSVVGHDSLACHAQKKSVPCP